MVRVSRSSTGDVDTGRTPTLELTDSLLNLCGELRLPSDLHTHTHMHRTLRCVHASM